MSTRAGGSTGRKAAKKKASAASKRPRKKSAAGSARTRKNPPTPDDWQAWVDFLADRSDPRPLDQLVTASPRSPLLWSLPVDDGDGETQQRIHLLHRLAAKSTSNGQLAGDVERWLERGAEADSRWGLDCLAWSHALPGLAQVLPAAPWCQLLEHLVAVANQSAGIPLSDDPLGQQILAGELPLTLAYLFPELADCRHLEEAARSQLSYGIQELLDGEGMPGGRHFSLARRLLACWTRSGLLGQALGRAAFDEEAHEHYVWFVRQSLRLARHDGGSVLSPENAEGWPGPLLEAALDLADDAECRVMLERAQAKATDTVRPRKKPSLSVHSEWAEAAVLRCDWPAEAPQLALTYGNQTIHGELNSGHQTLWSGRWDPQVTVNGDLLGHADNWEEVCWVSDADGDYLELQINFDGGRVLQRQLFLARQDRFLFVADAVLGSEEDEIVYQSELPLAANIVFEPAKESREGYLRGKKRLARVLPLGFPEWRSQPATGELEATATGLRLRVRQVGRRLFAPLFIDLDPVRAARQLTWRQLTIAERLVTQSPDVAVGYRIQVNGRQWMVYRSLAPRGNRTLLGQNLSTEFILARFDQNGDLEKLIEIE